MLKPRDTPTFKGCFLCELGVWKRRSTIINTARVHLSVEFSLFLCTITSLSNVRLWDLPSCLRNDNSSNGQLKKNKTKRAKLWYRTNQRPSWTFVIVEKFQAKFKTYSRMIKANHLSPVTLSLTCLNPLSAKWRACTTWKHVPALYLKAKPQVSEIEKWEGMANGWMALT